MYQKDLLQEQKNKPPGGCKEGLERQPLWQRGSRNIRCYYSETISHWTRKIKRTFSLCLEVTLTQERCGKTCLQFSFHNERCQENDDAFCASWLLCLHRVMTWTKTEGVYRTLREETRSLTSTAWKNSYTHQPATFGNWFVMVTVLSWRNFLYTGLG